MNSSEGWIKVNQELIAKALGELSFEQIISPVKMGDSWELPLSSEVTYSFQGWKTIWDHLRVKPPSILRNKQLAVSSAQFFLDTQSQTGMDDIILGNFFEEMNNTLYSDLQLLKRRDSTSALELSAWDGEKLQTVLSGHPKILLNKGRIGWGAQALNDYAPESNRSIKLQWLAVERSCLQGTPPSLDLLGESFEEKSLLSFLTEAAKLLPRLEDYVILPVHPWQWDRFISIQFAGLIAEKKIIFLGFGGDHYKPQISLRTLSNVERPEKVDLKLPVSILNTSCVRGLPSRSIESGMRVSAILHQICYEDKFLLNAGTRVLKEKAGVALVHPDFAQVKDAPYRYHEYFGALWRESAQSKITYLEKAIITASLFHQDDSNQSLIGIYIESSGLSSADWLRQYFKAVVIPLYHLQLEYGVGMVAHGQNIILVMKDFIPTGMILKDFQGDLRLSTELPELGQKYFKDVESELTKLPPHYLIHDLITGHFITVLRFISAVMSESDEFPETEFYQILSQEIDLYLNGKQIPQAQNLQAETIQRVLLNKVRFSIGYADSSLRPLPMVGGELLNPLFPKGAK